METPEGWRGSPSSPSAEGQAPDVSFPCRAVPEAHESRGAGYSLPLRPSRSFSLNGYRRPLISKHNCPRFPVDGLGEMSGKYLGKTCGSSEPLALACGRSVASPPRWPHYRVVERLDRYGGSLQRDHGLGHGHNVRKSRHSSALPFALFVGCRFVHVHVPLPRTIPHLTTLRGRQRDQTSERRGDGDSIGSGDRNRGPSE